MLKFLPENIEQPLYAIYRHYYNTMKDYYLQGDKQTALECELEMKDFISMFEHPVTLDDIHYELHNCKFTQLNWPYRKRTGIYANIIKKEKEELELLNKNY